MPATTSPVKVAHVTTIDKSLRYLLLNQLKSIQAAGFSVTGVSGPGPDVEMVEEAGIQHIAVPMVRASNLTPWADLRVFWHLYRVFRRERFTIVHTHTAKADLYGQMAARLAGVPIVMSTLHGFYFHENMPSRWRRFYILLAKIGALCSDVILSQNPEDLETAARENICPPEKIKYLGNGIDVRQFDRTAVDPARVAHKRAALGIPEEAPVVGFVGRLVKDKGILELIAAAQRIHEQDPTVRFLFVGPIDRAKSDYVRPDTATACGLEDVCIFTGKRDDVPDLYAMMDVFVLPSHREAFPRSVMEASAMAVPCVVTNVRGCRTAVQEGYNGHLVPLHDVTALADAILDLLNNPILARQMGRAGREKALSEFDEERVFDVVKATYDRLLKEKKRATA